MSSAPRSTYHHGDARNALLRSAAELLEVSGAAGLSLRQLAEHAGLSRQAPYNHFSDKEALLAELVRGGFERLAEIMTAARKADVLPVVRLERAGEGYIAFAQNAPALFRLMFSRELVALDRYPEAKVAGERSYAQLCAIVTGIAPPNEVADLSLVAWSLVHGYATLCIEKGIETAGRRGERAALFAAIVAGSRGVSSPAPSPDGSRSAAG